MHFVLPCMAAKYKNARKKVYSFFFARICSPGAYNYSITHFQGLVYIYFFCKKSARKKNHSCTFPGSLL